MPTNSAYIEKVSMVDHRTKERSIVTFIALSATPMLVLGQSNRHVPPSQSGRLNIRHAIIVISINVNYVVVNSTFREIESCLSSNWSENMH